MNDSSTGRRTGRRRLPRIQMRKANERVAGRPHLPAVPSNLRETGTLHFPDGTTLNLHADDLIQLDILGEGSFGYVTLNKHMKFDLKFAVKHMRLKDEPKERKVMMQDIHVIQKSKNFPYTVEFYGVLFRQGEVLICMEAMNISLYHYYKTSHCGGFGMPQDILGSVCFAVLSAIQFLREELKIMHRDLKPSNILLADREGKVSIKLCDFGVAGNLINSVAKTTIGCKPYMSPERIEPMRQEGYSFKSDIWSLGISLVELVKGQHPYKGADDFKLLQMIMNEPSPSLEADGRYQQYLPEFVSLCLKACVIEYITALPEYNPSSYMGYF